jgi:hypothetical protein
MGGKRVGNGSDSETGPDTREVRSSPDSGLAATSVAGPLLAIRVVLALYR